MRKINKQAVMVILVFLVTSLFAQWDVGGYFESEADIIKDRHLSYFGYQKARFDLERQINKDIYGSCSILAKQYWGDDTFDLSDFTPLDPNYNWTITMKDTLYIDYLFSVLRTEKMGEFVFGRQPVSLGSGYIWNPTDIFAIKDNIDPTYELQGVTALRWLYTFFSFQSDLIIQPFQNGKDFNQYYALQGFYKHYEYTLSLINRIYKNVSGLIPQTQNDISLGISIVGEILTAGIWYESNTVIKGEKYPKNREWTFGMDYTTRKSWYFLGEIYHNKSGAGFIQNQYYSPERIMDYLAGNTRAIGKDYLMVLTQYPLNQWWRIGTWILRNNQDESLLWSGQITGSPLQDISVDLSLFIFIGNEYSEFGSPDSWVRARINLFY